MKETINEEKLLAYPYQLSFVVPSTIQPRSFMVGESVIPQTSKAVYQDFARICDVIPNGAIKIYYNPINPVESYMEEIKEAMENSPYTFVYDTSKQRKNGER